MPWLHGSVKSTNTAVGDTSPGRLGGYEGYNHHWPAEPEEDQAIEKN